jgi:hypothetical protein
MVQPRAKPGSSSTAREEQPDRVVEALLAVLVLALQAEQVEVVGLQARRRLALGLAAPRLVEPAVPAAERARDLLRDLVLDREQVRLGPVVALRPQVPAAGRVDELRREAHPPRVGLQAALEHVAHAQLPADLAQVDRLALVGVDRVVGDHQQVGVLGEVGDEVLGDPVGEPPPPRVAREVGERQDGDGRLGRQG